MSSLQVQLRSSLTGLIQPLHKPSVTLTNLTNSKTYDLTHQLYFELKEGPQYEYSPEFIESDMVSDSSLEMSQDEHKRLVDTVHNELLQRTKKEVDKTTPAFENWGVGINKTSPEFLTFLYYLINEKEECEKVELNREEAEKLSEIFSTLGKYYPFSWLNIKGPNDIGYTTLYNTHRTFNKLSHSFKELAEKKSTDKNAKLSLENILVGKK